MKNINKRNWLIVLLVVGLLILYGCKEKEGNLKFNHALHVVENEMGCDACHKASEEGKMQNPSMDECRECHDIDEDNPSEECLLCHSIKSAENDYDASGSVPEPLHYEDVIFEHETHEEVECSTCHVSIATNKSLGQLKMPELETCLKCHNGDEAPGECATCHHKIRAEKAPESHHGDWAEFHGRESRFSKYCKYCHGESKKFCQECHQTQKPKDHIFNWKTTQHGIEATHDRRLCATCHSASYCADCHMSQKPLSHARADWMTYTRENGHAEAALHNFRSCQVCHSQADCSSCHNTIIMRKK